MNNQTVNDSIKFLQAIQKLDEIIGGDNLLTGAIQHLELLERRYVQDSESYILEIPKDEYIAWLMLQEKYKQELRDQELELVEP